MAPAAEVSTKNGEALASKAGVRGKRGRPRGVAEEPPAKRVRRSETAPRRSTRVVKQTAEKETTRDAAKIVKKVRQPMFHGGSQKPFSKIQYLGQGCCKNAPQASQASWSSSQERERERVGG